MQTFFFYKYKGIGKMFLMIHNHDNTPNLDTLSHSPGTKYLITFILYQEFLILNVLLCGWRDGSAGKSTC